MIGKTVFIFALAASLHLSAAEPSASSQRRLPDPDKAYPWMGKIERLDPALDQLLAPHATIERLAGGFDWSEGPVWVKRGGYLLFSDVPRNVVFKWEPGIGTSEFLFPSGY